MNSMGSSMVTTFTRRVRLTTSSMAARVVDLPDPVGPVTRIRPRGSCTRRPREAGRPSSSKVIPGAGTGRRAMLTMPRWRKALTRTRRGATSSTAKSASLLVLEGHLQALRDEALQVALGVLGGQGAVRRGLQLAVDAQHGRDPDLQVQVGGPRLRRFGQQVLDGGEVAGHGHRPYRQARPGA